MAGRYDPDAFINKTSWPIRWMESLRLKKTCRALEPRPGDLVLDLGCGSGNLIELLANTQAVGVDLSQRLLNQAKSRLRSHPNAYLVKAPGECLPFADGTFDRIVCSEMLEHVLKPEAVLKEMSRVAKAQAKIVITLPNETIINRIKRLVLALGLKKILAKDYPMSDDMLQQWHLHEVDRPWLERQLNGGTLRLTSESTAPGPWAPFHYIFCLEKAPVSSSKK